MDDVKLLSPATNFAIVQLPGRRFPGIVVQGDSLQNFITDLEAAVKETDPAEREVILVDLIERFVSVRERYEMVLSQQGIERPYFRE